jgi:hypothetical protein
MYNKNLNIFEHFLVISQRNISIASPQHTDCFGAHQLSNQWIIKTLFSRKKP